MFISSGAVLPAASHDKVFMQIVCTTKAPTTTTHTSTTSINNCKTTNNN